jgi:hypothetical protein
MNKLEHRMAAGFWAFVLSLCLVAVACGDVDPNYRSPKDQTKDCIAQGGDPKFTQTDSGYITEFLGCVMP